MGNPVLPLLELTILSLQACIIITPSSAFLTHPIPFAPLIYPSSSLPSLFIPVLALCKYFMMGYLALLQLRCVTLSLTNRYLRRLRIGKLYI